MSRGVGARRRCWRLYRQAYVEGVSTRRVDDLVKALGCEGISKSQVSRICRGLDEVVEKFLNRPLDGGPYAYLWLDALTQKVREGGRIVNVSVVVGTAVNVEGKREIVGLDVGTSEDGAFWLSFLRSLVARGLNGVELIISDAHQGLRNAIATVFGGACWQRCRTHFVTNLLTRVPKRAQPWVATMVRSIYQQPSSEEVHIQHEKVVEQLQERFPQASLDVGRSRVGHTCVHELPDGALEEDLVEQSAGEVEQGDKATDRCGGDLPEPGGNAPAGWRGARRAER